MNKFIRQIELNISLGINVAYFKGVYRGIFGQTLVDPNDAVEVQGYRIGLRLKSLHAPEA